MGKKLLVFVAIVIAGITGAIVVMRDHQPAPFAPIQTPSTATPPAAFPATRRAATTFPSYMDLIRAENPAVPSTQPLAFALDLSDAAHLIVHDPVYLDPSGHLWFTRGDGEPTEKALRKPIESTEHVIRDEPVFVHWWTTDNGDWNAAVIVKSGGGFDIITQSARQHLAGDRRFRWASAFSVGGKIIAPTDVGVSVFDLDPKIVEHYRALPGCTVAGNPPIAIADTRGILAWAPWENGRAGSHGISRFVDGNWTDLPADQWPARPIQLSILLDGSVLRLAASEPTITGTKAATAAVAGPVDPDEVVTPNASSEAAINALPDHISISIDQLESAQLDEKHVNELIAQLNDVDGDIRQNAYEELARYGPALAPLLEKVVDRQRPEGKMRVRQLLQNKIAPALGGMIPVDGRLTVARRFADGTVLFFAPAGVQIPTENDEPDLVNPAWIVQRPDGRMDRPLTPVIVQDQKPDAPTLVAVKDEWLVCDDAGPRRFFGNSFVPILGPAESRFCEIVGLSQRRRWILREKKVTPKPTTVPASQSTKREDTSRLATAATLIIDPLIADPTPKLPVWTIELDKSTAGWDVENFPAVIREEEGGNWELGEDGWKQLPATDKVHTAEGDVATTEPSTAPATTGPATAGRTTITSTTTGSLGKPLLVASDGTRYFGGRDSLISVSSDGIQLHWPLPPTATGTADPILIRTADRLLFLYNQPGRLLRIRPTPGEAEPFKLEAAFTKDIPDADGPARIWLDPAGRIDWITDGKTLSILFPTGHIPKTIANMMVDAKP